jgi:dolichyl-phosphate-mannose--protein O-mannosyl transferase
MLTDSLRFIKENNAGVPRLDLCKPDENGSPFFFWPFGGRSINYRWQSADGGATRYLYLQVNPMVWLAGLTGVILSFTLITSSLFFPLQKKMEKRMLLLTFLGLYAAYMIAISQIGRVMYLYHYFLPLLFSFILFAIVFTEMRTIGRHKLTEHTKLLSLLILAAGIFLSYQYYRPLTYFEPLTDKQVSNRAIVPLWELTCVHCPRENSLAIPREKCT